MCLSSSTGLLVFLVNVLRRLQAVKNRNSKWKLYAAGAEEEKEYPPYDGWYNNRAHPEWGVIGNCI